MVEILEVRQHRFVIRLHLQFVDVVAVAEHDIVQNSTVAIDEVLISFHFHCLFVWLFTDRT